MLTAYVSVESPTVEQTLGSGETPEEWATSKNKTTVVCKAPPERRTELERRRYKKKNRTYEKNKRTQQ